MKENDLPTPQCGAGKSLNLVSIHRCLPRRTKKYLFAVEPEGWKYGKFVIFQQGKKQCSLRLDASVMVKFHSGVGPASALGIKTHPESKPLARGWQGLAKELWVTLRRIIISQFKDAPQRPLEAHVWFPGAPVKRKLIMSPSWAVTLLGKYRKIPVSCVPPTSIWWTWGWRRWDDDGDERREQAYLLSLG